MIPSLSGGIYKFNGSSIEPIPVTADLLLKSAPLSFSSDLAISGLKNLVTVLDYSVVEPIAEITLIIKFLRTWLTCSVPVESGRNPYVLFFNIVIKSTQCLTHTSHIDCHFLWIHCMADFSNTP
jgi:hypothetical protein